MKQDYFNSNNIRFVDYKDIENLKRFLNPNGRILPRKRTGLTAKNQRSLAEAIKRSRFMGLLPFVAN
ncbi:30S ribosomal protein S18 [Candidatus Nomurabacteria bacterium]|nr:30S ribosomal protein S18 [Candidatus Nomurabacteria bacterium]